MPTASPVRLSLYDTLALSFEPTLPILADVGGVSILQVRPLMHLCMQAVISGLLAFKQAIDADTLRLTLLAPHNFSAVKNQPFGLAFIEFSKKPAETLTKSLFQNPATYQSVIESLSDKTGLKHSQVNPVLNTVCFMALKQIADISKQAKLSYDEWLRWLQMQSVLLAMNTARQTYLISVTPYHKHSHTCLIDNIEHWQDWISTNLWCDTPFDDNWHSVTGYQVNANINRFKNEENLSFTHLSTIPTHSTNPSVSHIWMEELAIFVNDIALQGDYLLCHQSSKTNPQASKKVRLLPSKLTTASKPKSSKPKPKQRPTTDAVSQPEDTYHSASPSTVERTVTNDIDDFSIDYDNPKAWWQTPLVGVVALLIGGIIVFGGWQYQQRANLELPEELPELSETEPDKKASPSKDVAVVRVEE